MENIFYIYGGMKKSQKTKLHVADEYGKPLCGVKSNWMECGSEINEEGFIVGEEHFSPIMHWRNNPCSKCIKKWKLKNV